MRPEKLAVALVPVLLWFRLITVAGYTRLAAVGDFGSDAHGGLVALNEATGAAIVQSLHEQGQLSGVLALGDTNYPSGSADTIDQNVGKHYGAFMWPLASNYSSGAPDHINRFFPCPGNHDWGNRGGGNLDAYLEYMPVAGRRTYDVVLGDVHLFALSSDSNEDRFEGTSATSKQAMWLKVGLSASTSTWKLVICHNPPFSSSVHGSSKRMRWPFEAWGATAVLSGHDHSYERVVEGDAGFPYFVNGLGGGSFYSFPKTKTLETGSAMRFAGRPAVQLIEADASRMIFRLLAAPHHHVESGEEGRLRETEEVDCYEVIKTAAGGNAFGLCSGGSMEKGGGSEGAAGLSVACLAEGQSCSEGLPPGEGPCCLPMTCQFDGRCGPQGRQAQRIRRRGGIRRFSSRREMS